MRLSLVASLLLSTLLISAPASAQQPPARDPQAVALAAATFRILGGGQVDLSSLNISATAAARIYHPQGDELGVLTIKARGLSRVRMDLAVGNQTRTTALSGKRASMLRGNGTPSQPVSPTIPFRCNLFPLLSPLADYVQNDLSVTYLGVEFIAGKQAQHILISSKSPGAAVQRFPQAGEFHIYLDSVSLIPLKAVYFTLSTRNTAPLYRIEDLYSDYRQVGSILVPFTVERSLNGHPYARFSLQSVNTNASLSEDDFLLR